MIQISVELVPRSISELIADARIVSKYKEVTCLNIPDIERLPIRSVDAVQILKKEFDDRFHYVPHIPASRSTSTFLGENIFPLVVQGDEVSSLEAGCYPRSTRVIADFIKQKHQHVYAACDQYRSNIIDEFSYIKKKRDVGASGIFTQPFFSIAHAQYWADILIGVPEVFFGVSPVLTEKSQRYWEEKNNVVFPFAFMPTLSAQMMFAREMIHFAQHNRRSVYFMPIRAPLEEYFKGIFS